MPWYRRGYYRRRRFWTRRPRRPFRRRFWRRPTRRRNYFYGVRKKQKLPYLYLRQWQPTYIHNLRITGTIPLYATTHARVANNATIYKDTIAPHFVPSLGGFSITSFTLNGLYQQFKKARAWWTTGNRDFPLIRYLYCKIYLYRSNSSDYIFSVHNCYPMKAPLEAYQACQPSIMMITKGRKVIRCKTNNFRAKPYKVLKVHPPAQFKNNWFFQKDIGDIPLLMWRAVATSLDRVYIASNSISSTIGFTALNTNFFQLHDWATPPDTTGYKPKPQTYMYSYADNSRDWENIPLTKLIYLGNSKDFTIGQAAGNSTEWETYKTTIAKWGNPFHPNYLSGPQIVLINTKPVTEILTETNKDKKMKDVQMQIPAEKFLIECRYNPFADRSTDNELYLVDCTSHELQWHAPLDPKLKTENLPMWLGTWGFIDFQKLQGTPSKVDTQSVLAFHTNYIEPKDLRVYVPLDDDFLKGNSPYRPRDNITPQDFYYWHPKTTFQYKSYNEICASGPYVIKLPPNVSAEGHCKFSFHFKVGGCAAPTKDIKDPQTQPTFPLPNNLITSTSLQSPATSIHNFLYNFDWRRSLLTQTATKRITTGEPTETTLFEPTGDLLIPQTSPQRTQEEDPPTSEKEKEALQFLIQQQQRRQQQFKQRIYQLLMSNIE
nr:MAG: ORF1 [TTV-like mini virus]UGV37416.1 MAG: ORF1 [TTV-like mini virus]UGV38488.1 MAG: ORF1 [TTV-like mini virus]